MSWFRAFKNFFSPSQEASAVQSFDPATFIAVCEEDPQRAKALLAADQMSLAQEIEETFRVYDERLEELASRTHDLSPKEVKREAKRIRASQDALRRALRRVEVSAKTAKELERELSLWEERENDAAELHADHPAVRAEMIRSEMTVRGTPPRQNRRESPNDTPVLSGIIANPAPANVALFLTQDLRPKIEERLMDEVEEPVEALPSPDAEHLLRAILEATREAERWHALPMEEHGEDALYQLHQVRELHAALKHLDREQGIRRDRVAIAVHPREFH
jgi:hypothetical protein